MKTKLMKSEKESLQIKMNKILDFVARNDFQAVTNAVIFHMLTILNKNFKEVTNEELISYLSKINKEFKLFLIYQDISLFTIGGEDNEIS